MNLSVFAFLLHLSNCLSISGQFIPNISFPFFPLFSQLKSSDDKVVLVFSFELNAFAPSSSISLSVNQWLFLLIPFSLFFLPHSSCPVMSMWYLLSVLHSLLLLLHPQSHCLQISGYCFPLYVHYYFSLLMFTDVNVVFTLSISLIAVAPSARIQLSVIIVNFLSLPLMNHSPFLFPCHQDLMM